ncbi:hypothetical protein TNCV_4233971 [Trichonephila clavipes]|nr:hypothetical protein TNCV_4233971 [Trichonephila clavipes]
MVSLVVKSPFLAEAKLEFHLNNAPERLQEIKKLAFNLERQPVSIGHRSFDEDIRLSESDCEVSEENANGIGNIPVNPVTYVTKGRTE